MLSQPAKRRLVRLWLAIVAVGAAVAAGSAEVNLAYDAGGRLVQIRTPVGVAQLGYDEAGNLNAIARPDAAHPAVVTVSPQRGRVGEKIRIIGTGFGESVAANEVRFQGVLAQLASANPNELVVTVPAGAMSGPLAVTSNGSTTLSPLPFTVESQGGVSAISSATQLVDRGATVTVSGSGFGNDASAIWVRWQGQVLPVVSVSEATLQFRLPASQGIGALYPLTSSFLEIGNAWGVQRGGMVLLPPDAYTSAGQFSTPVTLLADQPASVWTIPAGKRGVAAFVGKPGALLSLVHSRAGQTGSAVNATWHYRGSGGMLNAGTFQVGGAPAKLDLPALTLAEDVYMLVTEPVASDTLIRLALVSDQEAGSLVVNGSALRVVGAAPGRNQVVRVPVAMADRLSAAVAPLSIIGADAIGFEWALPNDNSARSLSAPGGALRLSEPTPSAGTTALRLKPGLDVAFDATLLVSRDQQFALGNAGLPQVFNSTRPGQRARFTFMSTRGDVQQLRWHGLTFAGTTSLALRGPISVTLTASPDRPQGEWLWRSPATGSYELIVEPEGLSTGQVSVALQTATRHGLTADGPPATVALTPGVPAVVTFVATQAQRMGLGVHGVISADGGYRPAPVVHFAEDSAIQTCLSAASREGSCNLYAVTTTGEHEIWLTPPSSQPATVQLTLSTDLQGRLSPNATAQTVSLQRVGQNARLMFAGRAGNAASVHWSGSSFGGVGHQIVITAPDGTTQSTTFGPAAGRLDWLLPQDGEYVVFVDPAGTATGSVQLRLTGDLPDPGAAEGDVPLPPWALLGLAAMLAGRLRRLPPSAQRKSAP